MNQVRSISVLIRGEGSFRTVHASAEIMVPGIGEIRITDCLSQGSVEQISNEVLLALDRNMASSFPKYPVEKES